MLLKHVSLESILTTRCHDIAVLLNTDGIYMYPPSGYNDLSSQFYAKKGVSSFAGLLVKTKIVPEFNYFRQRKLGEIIEIKKSDHTYHGIVCYKLHAENEIEDISTLQSCLNKIQNSGPIALSLEEKLWNKAHLPIIFSAIEKADPQVVLYH
ncbi:hypothetical protein IPF86_02965 [Candidatus Nomurabacteria bacterium]|nr:MAG: hypothetical protein IPF86_02965 [Candidatus Nomurabacteria bacterium]